MKAGRAISFPVASVITAFPAVRAWSCFVDTLMALHSHGGPSSSHASQFGDTTYTKIFVGGLAWETQRDTMRKYFEQFGEILEAVIITDRATGRSKGYGFVTFKDPESARGACMDPTPIIDGRRANCNLASLGQKQRQSLGVQHLSSQQYMGGIYGQPSPYAVYPPQAFGFAPYGYHPQMHEGVPYSQGMYAPYSPQGYPPHPGMFQSPGGGPPTIYGGYPSTYHPQALQQSSGSPNFGAQSGYASIPQVSSLVGLGGVYGGQQMPGGSLSGLSELSQQQQQLSTQPQQSSDYEGSLPASSHSVLPSTSTHQFSLSRGEAHSHFSQGSRPDHSSAEH